MVRNVTAEVEVFDGIDPLSPSFKEALAAGVTCSAIAPGSGNVIGGVVCAVKSAGQGTVESMCVNRHVALKAAMGGNPKGVYGKRNQMPMTRMGVASVLRQYFRDVQEYMKKQEEAQNDPAKMPKWDPAMENGAKVLRHEMPVKMHCTQFDMITVIELAKEKPKPEFNFLEARASGKCIFETEDLVIGYDEPLSRPLNLYMERGEKIAMVGANGIGKTTLLKSILGLIPAVSGKVTLGDYLSIGYFEQEMAPGNTTTCIDEIWKEFPSYTQYQVRSALAKCGLTTQHIESQVRVLSGGEQAKVRLCKLINRETNLLLLDEPTNHLDVEAKEELKRALAEYKGNILLICHEPDFYEGFATKVWDCSEWSLKI